MLASAALAQAAQQPRRQQFDFYVLALSWSPSFCATMAERWPSRATRGLQCRTNAFGFVVHGLWPQYDNGFPENCEVPAPRLNRAIMTSMLDLMPSPRLVFDEWDRHGTCSGLSPRNYFDTVREARSAVNLPAQFLDPRQPFKISPAAVEEAFIKANPALGRDDMAVECEAERLSEVRLCLSKDLKFRACPAHIVARSCRRDQVLVPPPRGTTTGAASGGRR
ncbi:MAG TPA: ribonuclease T2 [Xanthobacteraceae bacterium]|nr:ribonuclease T2 [Xanthobacteraceae bacterium]